MSLFKAQHVGERALGQGHGVEIAWCLDRPFTEIGYLDEAPFHVVHIAQTLLYEVPELTLLGLLLSTLRHEQQYKRTLHYDMAMYRNLDAFVSKSAMTGCTYLTAMQLRRLVVCATTTSCVCTVSVCSMLCCLGARACCCSSTKQAASVSLAWHTIYAAVPRSSGLKPFGCLQVYHGAQHRTAVEGA